MSQSISFRNLSSFLLLILTFRLSQQAGVGIGKLPSCARTCLNQGVTTTKCSSTTDFSCLCSSPRFEATISECFQKYCDHDEFAQSSQFLSTCSNYKSSNSTTPEETNQKETDDYTTSHQHSNKTTATEAESKSSVTDENEKDNPNVIVINIPTPVTPQPALITATPSPEKNLASEPSADETTKTNPSGTKKSGGSSRNKSAIKSEPSSTKSEADTDADANADADPSDSSSTKNSTSSDTSDDPNDKKTNSTHLKKNTTEQYAPTSSASQTSMSLNLLFLSFSLISVIFS